MKPTAPESPPPSSRVIYLARHGQSVWNKTKRVSGQMDPELAEEGLAQAERLGRLLARVELAGIYCSDLQRALATAQPTALAHGCEPTAVAALREQNLGIAEGRLRDDSDPQIRQLWQARKLDRAHFRMPGGGESYLDMEQRILPWLQQTLQKHPQGSLLIVGHRNTNRVLLGALMNWPRERVMALPIRNQWLLVIAQEDPPRLRSCSLREQDEGQCFDELKT